MKRYYIYLLSFIFVSACHEKLERNEIATPPVKIAKTFIDKVNSAVSEPPLKKINFNFLTDCDSLEIWKGGIQGVPSSDSTGNYIMAQCSSNRDFDLIIFSENEIELQEGADHKQKIIKSNIPGAIYYAFEIAKGPIENPENEFDTFDYIFPGEVNVYKLLEDGWYLTGTHTVKSFQELGRLKVNTIYSK